MSLKRIKNYYRNYFHNERRDKPGSGLSTYSDDPSKHLLCEKIIFLEGEYLKMQVLLKEMLMIILLKGVDKQGPRYRLEINKELGLRFIIQKCKGNAEHIADYLTNVGGSITLNVDDLLTPRPTSEHSPIAQPAPQVQPVREAPAPVKLLTFSLRVVQNVVHRRPAITVDSSTEIRPVMLSHEVHADLQNPQASSSVQTLQRMIEKAQLDKLSSEVVAQQQRRQQMRQQIGGLEQKSHFFESQKEAAEGQVRQLNGRVKDLEGRNQQLEADLQKAKEEISLRDRNRQTDLAAREDEHQLRRQGKTIMVTTQLEKVYACM